jgi:hypothetical protein
MSSPDDKLNGFAWNDQTVIRASALRRVAVFGRIQPVQASLVSGNRPPGSTPVCRLRFLRPVRIFLSFTEHALLRISVSVGGE